jgi:hypothetical protein
VNSAPGIPGGAKVVPVMVAHEIITVAQMADAKAIQAIRRCVFAHSCAVLSRDSSALVFMLVMGNTAGKRSF